MDKKYTFVDQTQFYDKPQNVDLTTTYYYYICEFANPETGRQCVRKFSINSYYEIIDIVQYHLAPEIVKKWISKLPQNKYKLLALYDLDSTKVPDMPEIIVSKSELLD